MLNNITIGQYYPVKSYIHSLDARIKLIATIVYITMLFFNKNIYGYIFSAAYLAMVIYASNVPISYMLRGLRAILFIIIFTVVLNVFFTPGENVLLEFNGIKITLEGVLFAVQMCVRISMIIIGSSLMTLTTSPIQLTDAIESLLKPFKKIGVPAHEIAMMMTITLRFIPTLMDETQKIMKAQMARGANFDTGGLIKRAKSMIPLLVPLFLSSFRRADELALAMEARCYRGDVNRTRMKILKFQKSDYVAIATIIIFTAFVIFLRFI